MKIIERKGEIARDEQFLHVSQCFFFFFISINFPPFFTTCEIVICKLFLSEIVQNLSFDNGLSLDLRNEKQLFQL